MFCGDDVNSRIKLSAREAVNGSYFSLLPAVFALILLFLFFSFCNSVLNYFFDFEKVFVVVLSAITLFLFVGFVSPIKLYLQIKFLILARGKGRFIKPEIGFSDILKACELSIKLFFVKLFWFSVFEFLPTVLFFVFVYYCRLNAVSLRAACTVFAGLLILALAGIVFYFVFTQRYSEAWLFLACYKDFTAADAIKESVRKTRNKLADIFFFKLGFIGHFLLCFGILPAFYVVPYYKQSVTCYFLSR